MGTSTFSPLPRPRSKLVVRSAIDREAEGPRLLEDLGVHRRPRRAAPVDQGRDDRPALPRPALSKLATDTFSLLGQPTPIGRVIPGRGRPSSSENWKAASPILYEAGDAECPIRARSECSVTHSGAPAGALSPHYGRGALFDRHTLDQARSAPWVTNSHPCVCAELLLLEGVGRQGIRRAVDLPAPGGRRSARPGRRGTRAWGTAGPAAPAACGRSTRPSAIRRGRSR